MAEDNKRLGHVPSQMGLMELERSEHRPKAWLLLQQVQVLLLLGDPVQLQRELVALLFGALRLCMCSNSTDEPIPQPILWVLIPSIVDSDGPGLLVDLEYGRATELCNLWVWRVQPAFDDAHRQSDV